MKTAAIAIAIALVCGPVLAKGGSHAVRGHVTKSGTYVAPTRATNPDKTRINNYSTRGNINPVSGKEGTKRP